MFEKVAIKRLSAVETSSISHQHELNGVGSLLGIFGHTSGKKRFPARFVYLSDREDGELDMPVEVRISGDKEYVTWYDARENHPRRTEYRLYYSFTMFQELASEGDLLVVGFDGETVWMFVAEYGSTAENQLLWLFTGHGENPGTVFRVRDVPELSPVLAGVEEMILESMGIELHREGIIDVERVVTRFNGDFPSTREFSDFAREISGIADSREDPDRVLMEWWNTEESLFRILEKYIVEERLQEGFTDVDDFTGFALSVINRRKSRAGHAFENHLEQIFLDHGLSYTRGGRTEGKSKPDFIFPSERAYADASRGDFPVECLTILGAKTTCKDRWRQVTREARLVREKHLATLEPAISEHQTDEMRRFSLQLVLPRDLFPSYTPKQREWLMDVTGFLRFAAEKTECRNPEE